jgi:hypothetical protein
MEALQMVDSRLRGNDMKDVRQMMSKNNNQVSIHNDLEQQ